MLPGSLLVLSRVPFPMLFFEREANRAAEKQREHQGGPDIPRDARPTAPPGRQALVREAKQALVCRQNLLEALCGPPGVLWFCLGLSWFSLWLPFQPFSLRKTSPESSREAKRGPGRHRQHQRAHGEPTEPQGAPESTREHQRAPESTRAAKRPPGRTREHQRDPETERAHHSGTEHTRNNAFFGFIDLIRDETYTEQCFFLFYCIDSGRNTHGTMLFGFFCVFWDITPPPPTPGSTREHQRDPERERAHHSGTEHT